MKFFNSYIYSIFEFLLNSLLFFLLAFLLINFYPYPYFLIGGLDGGIGYDVEPDYFANIISSMISGHSMDFLHPGILLHKITATMLSFSSEVLSVENIILLSRSIILFLNGILIYIGSRLVLRQDLIFTYVLYFIFLSFPAGFILIDIISPNSILFGFSVLIISLGRLVKREISTQMTLFSIFLGMAIAVKYTSIILAIPLAAYLMFDIECRSFKKNNLFKIATFIFFVTATSFAIFAWPMFLFFPYALTHHGFEFSLNIFVDHKNLIVFLTFILIVLFSSLYFFRTIISDIYVKDIYLKTSKYLLIGLVIILFFNFFLYQSLLSLGYSVRNYLLILGLVVIFLPSALGSILKLGFKYYILFVILFFALIAAKLDFNSSAMHQASKQEKDFSELLKKYDSYDYLVFYPPQSFISKDIFIAWSDYRYGDSRELFFEQNIPFDLSDRQKKVRILNSRKFDLDSPKYKFAFRYFDWLSKNNFLSDSLKDVAKNQMNLLKPKSFCNELFDGFDKNKNSILFFPASLNSYIFTEESKEFDIGKKYVYDLSSKLQSNCNINSYVEKIFYNKLKLYVLKIKQ
jgi:hypothetical protein